MILSQNLSSRTLIESKLLVKGVVMMLGFQSFFVCVKVKGLQGSTENDWSYVL